MRRVASHYIFWRRLYRMHYVELDENGFLAGVFPLDGEMAGTEFYDGIVIPVSSSFKLFRDEEMFDFQLADPDCRVMEIVARKLSEKCVSDQVEPGKPVQLYLLGGIPLTTPEFGTNDGRCNGYVKRL